MRPDHSTNRRINPGTVKQVAGGCNQSIAAKYNSSHRERIDSTCVALNAGKQMLKRSYASLERL